MRPWKKESGDFRGRKIKCIRFANNVVLLAVSKKLVKIFKDIHRTLVDMGTKINNKGQCALNWGRGDMSG